MACRTASVGAVIDARLATVGKIPLWLTVPVFFMAAVVVAAYLNVVNPRSHIERRAADYDIEGDRDQPCPAILEDEGPSPPARFPTRLTAPGALFELAQLRQPAPPSSRNRRANDLTSGAGPWPP